MLFAQKLQVIDDNMKSALRTHIIRKRQRLKQEIEQDAIEKRLRKEKELKRVQDAMTLDQIKEQLSVLEKRLEHLKSEKHDLFVQLKQVLSVGNAKTSKPDCQDADKVQKKSDVATPVNLQDANKKPTHTTPNEQHNTRTTDQANLHPKPLTSNNSNHHKVNESKPSVGRHPPTNPIPLTRLPTTPVVPLPGQRPSSHLQYRQNRGLPDVPIPLRHQPPMTPQFLLPSKDPGNFTKQSQSIRSHNLGSLQTNLRSPLAGPLPDFIPPGPYDPSIRRRLPYPDLGLPPNLLLTSDSALSLATRLQNDRTALGMKRSSSVANLGPSGGQVEDRSRKKPNSFALFPTNNSPYIPNGHNLPHDFPANLAFPISAINQRERFNSASPTITPVPINFNPNSHRNQLPHPLVSHNLDHLTSRGDLLLPNLNQLYATGLSPLSSSAVASASDLSSPFLPAHVLYPGSEAMPKQLQPMHHHHQLTQRINNGLNNGQLTAHQQQQHQQQEQASRYYLSNPPLVVDYRRKPNSKSSFHPKI